ncbi:hypothetical protein E4T56_gene17452, partial [Termitomyces sp. T112]
MACARSPLRGRPTPPAGASRDRYQAHERRTRFGTHVRNVGDAIRRGGEAPADAAARYRMGGFRAEGGCRRGALAFAPPAAAQRHIRWRLQDGNDVAPVHAAPDRLEFTALATPPWPRTGDGREICHSAIAQPSSRNHSTRPCAPVQEIPLAVLSDILALLDKWPLWKRMTEAPSRIDDLEKRLAALEATPKRAPGKTCKACGEPAMRLTASVADPIMGDLG